MYSLHTYLLDPNAYVVKYRSRYWHIPKLSPTFIFHSTFNLDGGGGWPLDDTVGTFICTFTCAEDLFESYPELFI